MNERDKELAIAAGIYTNKSKMLETFADLIRADAMEAATRAANQSWMLLAKSMIAAEREHCAKVVDHMASRCNDIRAAALESAAENIRARGNT